MDNKPSFVKIYPEYDFMQQRNNCEKTCSFDIRTKHFYGCSQLTEYMRTKRIPSEIITSKSVDCNEKKNCCFIFENCRILIKDNKYKSNAKCQELLQEVANSHSHIIQ